jgi:glycosyltransferase involved in cell wall biosynthesis
LQYGLRAAATAKGAAVNVTVTFEQRFEAAPDGTVWTPGQGCYEFLQRYLEIFDHVKVVGRVQSVTRVSPDWTRRADGKGVSFVPVPYFLGPWQYLRRLFEIKRVLARVAQSTEAAILHAPSTLSTGLIEALVPARHPYALEVVGDPWDVFAPGVIRHPLRPYFRQQFSRNLQRQCQGACATAYVTKEALQRRYPARPDTYQAIYSDVELTDASFVPVPRTRKSVQPINVVMVGSLDQLYKGPDVLLDALHICLRHGLNLQAVIVGDGQYRPYLEAHAAALGLRQRIRFAGQVAPGTEVRAELDQADLFVMPSRTEGLPRALIEAMARALPCIASKVGGIPELLCQEDLIQPGDPQALAQKLTEVINTPERLTAMSRRNLDHARQYHESALRQVRRTFYEYVRSRTAEWLLSRDGLPVEQVA